VQRLFPGPLCVHQWFGGVRGLFAGLVQQWHGGGQLHPVFTRHGHGQHGLHHLRTMFGGLVCVRVWSLGLSIVCLGID